MIRIKAQVGFVTHDSRSLSGFGIFFSKWSVYQSPGDEQFIAMAMTQFHPGIECLSGHLLLILDPLLRLLERTGQGAPGCPQGAPRVPHLDPDCGWGWMNWDEAEWHFLKLHLVDSLALVLWLLNELSILIILPWMIATESYFSWGGLFETTNQRWQWPPARSVWMKNDLGPIPPGHPDRFINKQSSLNSSMAPILKNIL